MRIEGTLIRWNDDRGFGFINPATGGADVFVHISAFPKDGRRPTVGERLTFEVATDGSGRKRATSLQCPDRSPARPARPTSPPRHQGRQKSSFLGRAIVLGAIVALVIYAQRLLSPQTTLQTALPTEQAEVAFEPSDQAQSMTPTELAPTPPEQTTPGVRPSSSSFTCDGRTHCSEMTSCDEAKYFLRNCPNVAMDGNNDGIPCERQWCKGLFAQ